MEEEDRGAAIEVRPEVVEDLETEEEEGAAGEGVGSAEEVAEDEVVGSALVEVGEEVVTQISQDRQHQIEGVAHREVARRFKAFFIMRVVSLLLRQKENCTIYPLRL